MSLKYLSLSSILLCYALCAQDIELDLSHPDYEGGYQALFAESTPLKGSRVDMRMKFGSAQFDDVHINDVLFDLRQNIPFTVISFVDDSVKYTGQFMVKDWPKFIDEVAEDYLLDVYIDPVCMTLLIEQSVKDEENPSVVRISSPGIVPVDWPNSNMIDVLRNRSIRVHRKSGESLFSHYYPFVFRSASTGRGE